MKKAERILVSIRPLDGLEQVLTEEHLININE
jgi:hypothetical protein